MGVHQGRAVGSTPHNKPLKLTDSWPIWDWAPRPHLDFVEKAARGILAATLIFSEWRWLRSLQLMGHSVIRHIRLTSRWPQATFQADEDLPCSVASSLAEGPALSNRFPDGSLPELRYRLLLL